MKSSTLIRSTKKLVKEAMAGYDASHDWNHVKRVTSLAKNIAQAEGITNKDQLEIIELGAILHDVKDSKYSGSETASAETVRQFFLEQHYPQEKIDQVVYIVENVSFRKEGCATTSTIELDIVKDADRIDAIGAIGIARCMLFTGHKKRTMANAIDHFDEKLFRLKHLMRTESGKKFASARHDVMVSYIDQLRKELEFEV